MKRDMQIANCKLQIANRPASLGAASSVTLSQATAFRATAGFTQQSFDAFLADRHEPAWLAALRRGGVGGLRANAAARPQQEEWRRTDIRGFHFEPFDRNGRTAGRIARRSALPPTSDVPPCSTRT